MLCEFLKFPWSRCSDRLAFCGGCVLVSLSPGRPGRHCRNVHACIEIGAAPRCALLSRSTYLTAIIERRIGDSAVIKVERWTGCSFTLRPLMLLDALELENPLFRHAAMEEARCI